MGRTVFESSKTPCAPMYISTRISNGILACAVVLHELVHTAVPYNAPDHGKEFVRIARGLGFRSPYSLIHDFSPELRSEFVAIRNKLGAYPKA